MDFGVLWRWRDKVDRWGCEVEAIPGWFWVAEVVVVLEGKGVTGVVLFVGLTKRVDPVFIKGWVWFVLGLDSDGLGQKGREWAVVFGLD